MGRRRTLVGSRMLITGASQGIGRALALAAAARGVRVLAVARSAPLLAPLADEVRRAGGTIQTVTADVTSPDDRQRDGGGCPGALWRPRHPGQQRWHRRHRPLRRGRRRTPAQDHGGQLLRPDRNDARLPAAAASKGNQPAIVNISSIAGKRGIPARSEYSASKFAVQGFSEALRAELAKDGIDVLVVCPGLTQTNFSQNMIEQKAASKLDHMRGMTSEQVATATLRAIERGSNEMHLTLQGKLMVFVSRFFPRLADRIAARRVRELFKDEMAARQASSTPRPARP